MSGRIDVTKLASLWNPATQMDAALPAFTVPRVYRPFGASQNGVPIVVQDRKIAKQTKDEDDLKISAGSPDLGFFATAVQLKNVTFQTHVGIPGGDHDDQCQAFMKLPQWPASVEPPSFLLQSVGFGPAGSGVMRLLCQGVGDQCVLYDIRELGGAGQRALTIDAFNEIWIINCQIPVLLGNSPASTICRVYGSVSVTNLPTSQAKIIVGALPNVSDPIIITPPTTPTTPTTPPTPPTPTPQYVTVEMFEQRMAELKKLVGDNDGTRAKAEEKLTARADDFEKRLTAMAAAAKGGTV